MSSIWGHKISKLILCHWRYLFEIKVHHFDLFLPVTLFCFLRLRFVFHLAFRVEITVVLWVLVSRITLLEEYFASIHLPFARMLLLILWVLSCHVRLYHQLCQTSIATEVTPEGQPICMMIFHVIGEMTWSQYTYTMWTLDGLFLLFLVNPSNMLGYIWFLHASELTVLYLAAVRQVWTVAEKVWSLTQINYGLM